MLSKERARQGRHSRIRKKISGSPARPRLSLTRSLNHLYAQLIDDQQGTTLLGFSTRSKECSKLKGGNVKGAKAFGLLFAKKAADKNLKKAVFDRGGHLYHGRVKAFADGVREGGVEI